MQLVLRIVGLVLVWAYLSAIPGVYAQQQIEASEPHFSVLKNGKSIATTQGQPDLPVRIIVEFDTPPVSHQSPIAASKNAQIDHVNAEHHQFAEDLSRLFDGYTTNAGKVTSNPKVKHFKAAINGVALEIPLGMIREIRKLDYVKHVFEDGVMEALRLEIATSKKGIASGLVSAEETGKGVRIAVIDTGIDYNHSALGGGYGSGFKVIGGYDFVNEDYDPIDDNGHGTHVAGIAAGQGDTWQGVAPEASLLAYKVLDEDGAGMDSWVLAAIERALDPDQNPLTDDAVDIINLSLGSGAGTDSNHPVTLAVENAVKAGVVCVVAAGNSGFLGKASIAAPGNALAAITVGAATEDARVADFSAQGPTGSIKSTSLPRFGMKPDVFAPGVDVESTWLNNGFKLLDGTSMATPHIAGLAARLMQANPTWSPDMIKSAIVQLADSEGMLTWLSTPGLAGPQSTDNLTVLPSPSRFDFGLVENVAGMWSFSDTLRLHNFGAEPQTYNLSASGDYPAGVTFNLANTVVTVSPQEVVEIPFQLSGSLDNLPVRDFPNAYEGTIIIDAAQNSREVPFSFFNPGLSRLSIDEPADVLLLFGKGEDEEYSFFDLSGDYYLFLPEDEYDAIAQFDGGSHVVIKENVFETGETSVHLSKSEAVHSVYLNPLDIHQNRLQHVSGMHAITHKATGYAIAREGGFLSNASNLPAIQYFSDFSDAYKLEIKATGFAGDGYYEIPFAITGGIDAPVELSNHPDSLIRIDYQYNVPEDNQELFFVPWSQSSPEDGASSTIAARLDVNEGSPFKLMPPFHLSIFLAAPPSADFSWKEHFHTIHDNSFSLFKLATNASQMTLYETNRISVSREGEIQIGHNSPVMMQSDNNLELYPGLGMMRWAGRLNNGAGKIRIEEAQEGGFFVNEFGDLVPRGFALELYQGETLISADSLFNAPNLPVARWLGESQMSVAPGAYTLIVEDEYKTTHNWFARATAKMEFDTQRADADPPALTQLYVESDGKPQRILHPDGTHRIIFDLQEECSWCDAGEPVEHHQIQIRALQDSAWMSLESSRLDEQFEAAIPHGLQEAFYAIQIIASDEKGNTLTYTLEPAFELGMSKVPQLQLPEEGKDNVASTTPFVWQPIQDAISYQFQLAKDRDFVDILVSKEVSDQNTVQVDGLADGQRFFWRVRAKTMEGFMPWSIPFWFDTVAHVSNVESQQAPADYQLNQAFPNPVANVATITYSLPGVADVTLELYDLLGRRLSVLVQGIRPAGNYTHKLDAQGLPGGAYIIRLKADDFTAVQKFIKQ